MEKVSAVSTVSFVQPHFVEELGTDGLTLHDVAQSLGVEFSAVKKKFDRMLTDNRVKSLYVHMDVTIESGTYTERIIQSYGLATETAKFFVAKWDSELGDAYCRFLVECEKALVSLFEEMSPELRYLIKIEHAQKQQQKQLTQLESTLKETGLSVMDSTLSAPQIEALENLFSELYKVSKRDGPTVGRMKSALKAQFLNCAKTGVTYKDVPQKHFESCVDLVKQKIATFA